MKNIKLECGIMLRAVSGGYIAYKGRHALWDAEAFGSAPLEEAKAFVNAWIKQAQESEWATRAWRNEPRDIEW